MKEIIMFDAEELTILETLEQDKLARSIDADEEIALACKAAKEYFSKFGSPQNSEKIAR